MNRWVYYWVFVILYGVVALSGVGVCLYHQIKYPNPPDTVLIFEGKRYSPRWLIGAGHTHKNRVPVYSVVFVPADRKKDAV